MCNTCPQRGTCRELCEEMATILQGLDHSLTSHYLVKFVDPFVLDAILTTDFFGQYSVTEKRQRLYNTLDKKISKLKPIQKECILYYYGLRGKSAITQPKIAILLGITQEAVCYHLIRAKKILEVRLLKYMK